MLDKRILKAEEVLKKEKENVNKEYRLGYHIMAPANWINDPNGLIYCKGKYHFFYQFNPYSGFWSQMHWGHAVSDDLLHWEHLPVALAPSEIYDDHPQGGCFSGSAIEKDGDLYLVYTGTANNGNGFEQTQNVAVSVDGVHFSKCEGNPVIEPPEGVPHDFFRDPKVWEHEGLYYLVCGAQRDGRAQALLYRSKDLLHWEFFNVLFESRGEWGFMWECPDFFPLDGKQVLMLGPMEMLPKGEFHNGHNVIAFIGSYDQATHTFTKENVQLMDGGIDFYATQTTLAPDGRRIMTAWLQTWSDTEDKPKGCKWFGQTICPRELHIKDGRIVQTPVRELDAVHGKRIFHENVTVQNETSLEGIKGRVADLTVTVQPGEYRSFILKLAADADHHTSLTYDPYTSELTLDRSYAGSRADIVHRRSCKVRSQNGALKLRILLDKNSIEVFANDGEQTMTAWIYTPQSAQDITFAATGSDVNLTVEQYELNL